MLHLKLFVQVSTFISANQNVESDPLAITLVSTKKYQLLRASSQKIAEESDMKLSPHPKGLMQT